MSSKDNDGLGCCLIIVAIIICWTFLAYQFAKQDYEIKVLQIKADQEKKGGGE